MHIDQFNTEFEPFYAEFGYFGSVHLPEGITPLEIASDMTTRPDNTIAIVVEHTQKQRLFVLLYWRSLRVGKFDCTQEQYDQEFIPLSVIEAAQNYSPQ